MSASILPRMENLNATAACVLGLLQLGPAPGMARDTDPEAMTGWQLAETARRSLIGFWHITRSQIYRELPRLAAAGLVEEGGAEGPRASRPYRITAAGRAAFSAWLGDWAAREPRDDQLRSPLLLAVFFGDSLPPETLRCVLSEYRPRYARQLERLHAMLGAIGPEDRHNPPTAVLRRGIAYRALMVQWIDETLAELDLEEHGDRETGAG